LSEIVIARCMHAISDVWTHGLGLSLLPGPKAAKGWRESARVHTRVEEHVVFEHVADRNY